MTLLEEEAIKLELARLKGWKIREGKLYREVQFGSFKVALRFMKDIEIIAERINHHPDICVYYDRVVIESVTHDEGGISEKDFEIAHEINALTDRLKI
ncbi:MAG: 4a-hydroxytetrahydrobiopterin dehydratase [Candidatus Thermoplasmatota archaeon]|nr:4a-hydroxytetrahydrobiopterin dehydratase [Candidatus Thermoplasmatota archaeon]